MKQAEYKNLFKIRKKDNLGGSALEENASVTVHLYSLGLGEPDVCYSYVLWGFGIQRREQGNTCSATLWPDVLQSRKDFCTSGKEL